jgi:hypothetical protein
MRMKRSFNELLQRFLARRGESNAPFNNQIILQNNDLQ